MARRPPESDPMSDNAAPSNDPPPAQDSLIPAVPLAESRASLLWIQTGTALLDTDRRILRLSDELIHWFQRAGTDPIGQPWDKIFGTLAPAWLDSPRWDESKPFSTSQLRILREEGSAWYEVELVHLGTGWTLRIQSTLPPFTELAESPWNAYLAGERESRQMFIRLLRAEAQLANLMDSWPGVLFSQRADFSFQSVSPRISDLTGIGSEQWLSKSRSFWQVIHEADAEELQNQCRRAIRSPAGVTTYFRVRNLQTGRVAHVMEHRQAVVSASGLIICYEGFWLDVTREKIAERRLSSSAWKETLATLTMGLAHDFSNILAGILSLSESFLSQTDDQHPFTAGLNLIRGNAMQACQLVQRMMSLHRCQTGEQNYLDLNETIAELTDLAQRVLPRRILVETQLSPRQLPLYVDAVELRQVVLNIALNAAEAMPQRGKLTFRTEYCESGSPPPHTHGKFPHFPCVCLSAQDSGCGIAPRHLPLVFDPFFTTKPVNKGSGLGLYNARLFVERHRGAISVSSQEGVGTQFSIWLPLADFSEAERVQNAVVQQRPSILLAGEPGFLHDSTAEFLRVHGYYVLQAFAPDRTRDILAGEDNQFHGLAVLASPADTSFLHLIPEVRQSHPKLTVILQLVGGDPEQLPSDLLPRIDLLIGTDMSEAEMVRRIRNLFT
jgi:PAS domain S-box-containing protein